MDYIGIYVVVYLFLMMWVAFPIIDGKFTFRSLYAYKMGKDNGFWYGVKQYFYSYTVRGKYINERQKYSRHIDAQVQQILHDALTGRVEINTLMGTSITAPSRFDFSTPSYGEDLHLSRSECSLVGVRNNSMLSVQTIKMMQKLFKYVDKKEKENYVAQKKTKPIAETPVGLR